MRRCILFIGIFLLLLMKVESQIPQDIAIEIKTKYLNSTIQLTWEKVELATGYIVYRKNFQKDLWEKLSTVYDTIYEDNYIYGQECEYRVMSTGTPPMSSGYISTGFYVPAEHYRGKVILLVDSNYTLLLSKEIERLIKDLAGDGWHVIRHNIGRTRSVGYIKQIVKDVYNADKDNVKSLFILGHIAIPYSGFIYPDGHTDHKGAWPADGYYADLSGTYTDNINETSSPSRIENKNVAGDGKFDQYIYAGLISLETGRVDLYNMPLFSSDDVLLIKRYLDKNHKFRMRDLVPRDRSLIDDNFGFFGGESFSTSGWRAAYSMTGKDSTFASDYFGSMKTGSYLLSYGCGGGTYTSSSGIGTSSDFARDSLRNVFTMLFGSYFGDWDNKNNFLRAPLASKGWALASWWSGRPYTILHSMGMGKTAGYATKVTMNNNNTYVYNYYPRIVSQALMGDPTLRLKYVAPVENLNAMRDGNEIKLSWNKSKDSVMGYYIYRADSVIGEFQLLNTNYINTLSFSDNDESTGKKYYMVRAVKLENAITGSYYNLSTGIIVEVNKYNLEGKVYYKSGYEHCIEGVQVYLQDSTRSKMDSVSTDLNGNYKFINVIEGNYELSCERELSWKNCTPTDALKVVRTYLGIAEIFGELMQRAADVNLDYLIDPEDALMISRRYVRLIDKFTIRDWLFEKKVIKLNENKIVNIYGVCAGDVN